MGRGTTQDSKDDDKVDSGITKNRCTNTNIIATIERAVHVKLKSDRLIAILPKKFESEKKLSKKLDKSDVFVYSYRIKVTW